MPHSASILRLSITTIVAGLLLLSVCAIQAEEKRLNVLLITADDLGLQLGCYGESLIETPYLDRLAASGTQFQVAYVAQASCSPSRSAMFTGLHTHATGQYGLTGAGFNLRQRLRDKTIPNLLRRAGYKTGIIGKLHVAPESSFQFDSRRKVNTRQVSLVAAAAGDFMREAQKTPFFLMVNYSDPHAFRRPNSRRAWYFPPQVNGLPEHPLPPSEKTIFDFQQIDTKEQRVRTAGYYNAVQRLDVGIGMLLDELHRLGHDDDTLVIFVGDHGPPFARGKTTVYEAGVRVPFLIRWPGVSQPMKSDAMVSTIDILPTILDATGVSPPHKMHGRSLRPVVSSKTAPWREYLVAEFHCHGRQPFYPRRAIRDRRYKLIHNLLAGKAKPSSGIDGDPAFKISQREPYRDTIVGKVFRRLAAPPEYELYDLERDPIEFHNLADDQDYADVRRRLTKALLAYRHETDDPFLDSKYLERFLR